MDPNAEIYNSLAEALGRSKVGTRVGFSPLAFAALWASADDLIDWSASFDVMLDTYPAANAVYQRSITAGWHSMDEEDSFLKLCEPLHDFEMELFIAQCVMNAALALEGGLARVDTEEYDYDNAFSERNLAKANRAFADYRESLNTEFEAKMKSNYFIHNGFEWRYIVTQFASEGPEYMEIRQLGAEEWLRCPEDWPEPPKEVMEHFFGPVTKYDRPDKENGPSADDQP